METDLASFLAPAGSLLGEVTQNVLEFLSVQDLLEYVASSAASHLGNNNNNKNNNINDSGSAPGVEEEEEEAGSPENPRRQRQPFPSPGKSGARRAGGGTHARASNKSNGRSLSPEEEVPHHRENISSTGAGDEAGGGSRPPTPHRGGGGGGGGGGGWAQERQHPDEEVVWGGSSTTGERWRDSVYGDGVDGQEPYLDTKEGGEHSSGRGGGGQRSRNVQVVVRRHGDGGMLSGAPTKSGKTKNNQGPGHLLGVLIGLGLHPWAALGALRGGVAHLLGGVPLLALLRWAAGGASAILGVSFRVALLPYDVTKGAVQYVVGSLEAMLNVATEIWCELRHLSLSELAVVISCVVSGNALPDFLLNPLDYEGGESGSSGGGGGGGVARNSRIFSRSSRGTASLESDEERGFLTGYLRGASRGYSDAGSRSCGPSSSRGAWQQAHAMRRRLDRVNRTASLVSYEERAESAVTRAKAQRVRRRMHYAMSLQCFQATVTVDDRVSRAESDADEDGVSDGGRTSAEGGSSSFMCTPQSFPPTPVSRAHVMARTSQFSDDILFLARDQLRLGENLKPGVDETTRATADFLRRQQRLAVLDGNNACEGIVLTCGHHRATKVGPSLYSSARAMVPVLRNRHVYFQVSCMREGPLAPSIGVGLSTPEMPLSTLVGAFSNSVGLCSTGQVLMSSRWYGEPGEFAMHKMRMSTVGVLVYLDGSRPFRSWDGDMVRALVCFSVDGRLVRVATGPVPQAPAALSAPTGTGGGVVPPSLQQQPSVYGPPPPPTSPTRAQRPQASASATPGACATAGGQTRTDAVRVRGVEERREEEAWGGVGGLLSPSPWSPPMEEEIAPWEVAASAAAASASATAAAAVAAAAAVDEAHVAGGGGGGGRGGGGAAVGRAAPGAAGVRGMVAPAAVPETSAALGLALPKDRDLFPTVTIHSANTEVMCRFCAEDLIHVSRESMGAPPGVAVYALDGSLINLP